MLISYDDAAFRAACPFFVDPTTYPPSLTEGWWNIAINFVSNCDNNCFALNGAARALGINLMAGHIGLLTAVINGGQTPATLVSAQIDKVSVTVDPPPKLTEFQWWLNLTGYGQQVAVLLSVKGVGGFYVGGNPERAAFRRVGGLFG